jgi:hypothetical protein
MLERARQAADGYRLKHTPHPQTNIGRSVATASGCTHAPRRTASMLATRQASAEQVSEMAREAAVRGQVALLTLVDQVHPVNRLRRPRARTRPGTALLLQQRGQDDTEAETRSAESAGNGEDSAHKSVWGAKTRVARSNQAGACARDRQRDPRGIVLPRVATRSDRERTALFWSCRVGAQTWPSTRKWCDFQQDRISAPHASQRRSCGLGAPHRPRLALAD